MTEAFEQIHDRKYYDGMEGRVILIGMAFWNQVPKVRIDSVMNGDGFAVSDAKAGRVRCRGRLPSVGLEGVVGEHAVVHRDAADGAEPRRRRRGLPPP